MNVTKQWLQTCKTEPGHSQCREAYGTSPGAYSTLPTRVINVGSENEEPFLFESNGQKAPYCILSYCWDRPGNAITTRDNLSNRLQRIPLLSLPTFIHQAILTTRRLGYKYVWIDALCIIQDDVDDWAREASTMHELYSQADLTISSLIASDSRDSLFDSRPRQIVRPIPLNLGLPKRDRPNFKEGTVFEIAACPDFKEDIKLDGPIHQRAWILQEQLLSTRVLYFGAGILHWECLHSYHFEHDPSRNPRWGLSQSNKIETRRNTKLVLQRSPKWNGTLGEKSRPIEVWQSQVEEFTRRKLTKASDRIPAFLAISKVLCKVAGDHFVGEIWTGNHLFQTLCWTLKQPNNTEPTGPTWTWASRSGEVSYSILRHSGSLVPTASVVLCDVGADTSHSTISGSITLKGFFGACRAGSGPAAIFDHISGSAGPLYILDMLELRKEAAPSVATEVRSSYYPEVQPLMMPEHDAIVSLLLKPVNDKEDFKTASRFHRVGIYRMEFDQTYCAGFSPEKFRSVTEFETDRVVTIV
ncbi:HET domain-containing protein [Colletotrichum musicola]|uniref:HET domain-containing protein n=1 Tax=Colletotrichum musicola TaxID=2175873 RepID=A0A8H6IP52_9PEZI|nr:HET domain-containing protein [Colletotrichum musicola]